LKPAEFQYHRPREINEALTLLKEVGEDGKILAGGQSLMPMMNFRLAEPAHLIDINFIAGLDYIRSENGALKIGCLARQSRVLSDVLVRQRCPLLTAALAHVGYEQTRNRGTFCGSLAHADPAAELPAVLLALDGSVTVGKSTRKREIAARDFFQSYLTTALANDEMVLEASVPEQPARSGSSFVEFARRFGDFAIVGVAASLVPEQDKISDARIALTGVGDKPWREQRIEQMLIGQRASAALFGKIGGEIAARIDPGSDIHASESYRRSLARVLTRRALTDAWGKAQNLRLQTSSPLTGEE
jgi:carbon-monoxide dehydrogenase medium subunit/2-furoyl-CoA dehydrogenase FAD binding subunit